MSIDDERRTNRATMPGVAALVDGLRAAGFAPKVLWACENGHQVGQRESFDGIDVDRLLALDARPLHAVKVRPLPAARRKASTEGMP